MGWLSRFEVYEGFNQEPLDDNERFRFLDYNSPHRTDKYYPVRLVDIFDINNLPTEEEFLNTFKSDED